ncbi:hypothetical protein BKA70DRAFT_1571612 [Coprinopsis sp. MPI-PUGE-AT-0042]|nr:hypothetical protein BKA70DRAFT_1571612 [Coprinopsis sp. MPI-PUGE-AT-0042]
MEELEALLAEYKNVNGQLANDPEALEGPTVSTDEFENVRKENKARQTISEHGQEIASQATKIDELGQAEWRNRKRPTFHRKCVSSAWQRTQTRHRSIFDKLLWMARHGDEQELLGHGYRCRDRTQSLVVVMAVVKPSPDDATPDARAHIHGEKRPWCCLLLYHEQLKHGPEPVRDPGTALDLCNLKSEVEGW